MTIWIIRAVFLLVSGRIGYWVGRLIVPDRLDERLLALYGFWGIVIGVAMAGVIIGLEVILSQRPIRSISSKTSFCWP